MPKGVYPRTEYHQKTSINNLPGKNSIPWNKGKKYTQISGSKHWNWKGGGRKCIDCGRIKKSYGL